MRASDRLIACALLAGVAVPFLYYGIQLAAAPSFPGFSFVRTTASELGSDLSLHPRIFNLGIMTQGAVTLVASAGLLFAFRRLGTHLVLSVLTSLCTALNGVQTLWAGTFPMPDPRHGGHPAFIIGMLLLPILLTASMWRLSGRFVRAYFLATLLLLAAMFPIMSGLAGIDTHAYRGLQQRIFTLAIFPPIGVASFVLSRRLW